MLILLNNIHKGGGGVQNSNLIDPAQFSLKKKMLGLQFIAQFLLQFFIQRVVNDRKKMVSYVCEFIFLLFTTHHVSDKICAINYGPSLSTNRPFLTLTESKANCLTAMANILTRKTRSSYQVHPTRPTTSPPS